MATEVANVTVTRSDAECVEMHLKAKDTRHRVLVSKQVVLEAFIDAYDKARERMAGADDPGGLQQAAEGHPRAAELAGWKDVLLAFDRRLAELAEVEVEDALLVDRYVEEDEPEIGPLHAIVVRAVFTDRSLHRLMNDVSFSSYMISVV